MQRQTFVTRIVAKGTALCVLFVAAALSAPPAANGSLEGLLKAIEDRYNRSQSLKLNFSETYAGIGAAGPDRIGRPLSAQTGADAMGICSPAGKVFLSDGKQVFQYMPDDHQAKKSKLKQSDDMRAPLAFLLGKLDFGKEFKSFETSGDPVGTWIIAAPKSDNLIYNKVEFLASADGEIHRFA